VQFHDGDTLAAKEEVSFMRLLDVLEEEFEIVDSIQEEMLRVIVKKLLIKSTRLYKSQCKEIQGKDSKIELMRQFRISLEKNFKQLRKVSEYANLLNKSPKTLTNVFKQLDEESPSKMIQQRIVAEAKRYLLYSSLSVKEIAYTLGFEDASAFSQYFKNFVGVAPLGFREGGLEKVRA
ncbi:MAG: helix-turn-helix domain-containing protein, partial [Bacteroidota bacterium]